ncbi:RNA-binding protein [candidate division WOR-1 bacterium RIFOXYB2_FULL_42_35]|uniref:RNA-binding protein n=1 Tax=candidate division WOR-1 bacterium RIFOXYC2_FULL_41_25 TaxID=1802586 RepID=A0A1F4TM21_UNCSA|nr:MAG: RNA-binding protein [candidate division WOR-1 bacterium RIFOXYA2_FULL_41_14]OGC23890.1 MAG: RNA-binding protein [candidate division WOR-1 bacterium RIFOXYB2_FULL_42_35]OGC33765.1 MAG: RNA-binding protein [candidate division WOR-1 bacterium RIFOXYC2_FULL_41_25]OGC44186.1 MAG: RNA-binding protein [candidate division WOR-1 bacterium RIFOXYD2_FULL_41_8]
MKSIFVGNLPWSAKNEDLEAKFSEFGNVTSARVMTDKFTGKSRGFGFVDMEDADAEKAIAALADYEWEGRKITVNEARPKTERSDSRDRGPRRDSYGF